MAQGNEPDPILDGKYRLVRRLGQGGFGDVYLADDVLVAGHRVAIKVLRERVDGDQGLFVGERMPVWRRLYPCGQPLPSNLHNCLRADH